MGDIASILPQEPPTTTAIYAHWKTRGDSEPRRRYLGMSSIGEQCERWLWYSFRHAAEEDFPGRLYRLFNRGHREELVIAEELRGIGCEVHLEKPEGGQFGFSDIGGHFKGHMDAAILGVLEAPKTWHVGELKTHNNKLFNELLKHGVAKAHPKHFAQMQSYMRYSGMTRTLYVAINKDNDEIYTERVRYDAAFAGQIEAKAHRVVTATKPPAKIAERRDDFRCKFCAAKALCHGTSGPEPAVPIEKPSCRQCVHATPELDGDGRWSCAKHGKDLTTEDQERRCPSFLLIPDFVTFADPIDAHKTPEGEDVIEFRNHADGAIWHHGPNREQGHYGIDDLRTLPAGLVGSAERPMEVKPKGDTTLITPDLLTRYSHESIQSVKLDNLDNLLPAWRYLFEEAEIPEPLNRQEGNGWSAAEFSGERLILVSSADNCAEIRIHAHPDNDFYRKHQTRIDTL
jgi:hypothetical protein